MAGQCLSPCTTSGRGVTGRRNREKSRPLLEVTFMRTRRSPRNQERLWRELGGKTVKPEPLQVIRTDAEIDAMFWISKTSRNLLKRDMAKLRATVGK